jgi:hypothetical protein
MPLCSDGELNAGWTPEQWAEEARIFERLGPLFDRERQRMARLLASKSTGQLFGRTEYELRERVNGSIQAMFAPQRWPIDFNWGNAWQPQPFKLQLLGHVLGQVAWPESASCNSATKSGKPDMSQD